MSCFFSRTSSSSWVAHKQLLHNNKVAQIVATTATASMLRSVCSNISTVGWNEVQMSAHSGTPSERNSVPLFFPHRKLWPSLLQRGTSDVTSDGGAAAAARSEVLPVRTEGRTEGWMEGWMDGQKDSQVLHQD